MLVMLRLQGKQTRTVGPTRPIVPYKFQIHVYYLLQKKPTSCVMNHLFSVLNYTQFGTGPLTVFGGVEVGEN